MRYQLVLPFLSTAAAWSYSYSWHDSWSTEENNSWSSQQKTVSNTAQNVQSSSNNQKVLVRKQISCRSASSLVGQGPEVKFNMFKGNDYSNNNNLAETMTFATKDSDCDASIFNCWIKQINNPQTCFDMKVKTQHEKFLTMGRCAADKGGNFICFPFGNPSLGSKFQEYEQGNSFVADISCKLSIPQDDFVINWVMPSCFIGRDKHCSADGDGTAICDASPLILDMNHNGVIEAITKKGIDLDGDGTPDGAATGGDKMLAMSDLNGNKVIDGEEVFGDQTISPYTKKPYLQSNGFESLRQLANEASLHHGKSIIKNDSVDMLQLFAALKEIGVTLGFVSDNNNRLVEPLLGVKSINLKYQSKTDNSVVARKELGTFVDFDDETYPVDDVWFQV